MGNITASSKGRHSFRNKDIETSEIFDCEEFKLQGGRAGYKKQDKINPFSVHEFVWPGHEQRLAKIWNWRFLAFKSKNRSFREKIIADLVTL